MVVALSRSGTTTEVAHALMRSAALAHGRDHRGAGLAGRARRRRGRRARRSPTSSRWCRRASPPPRSPAARAQGIDLAAAIADAERALAAPLPVEPGDADQLGVPRPRLDRRPGHEAALKLREAAQAWTEAYPAFEYRHGPISIAGPGAVVWSFGPARRSVLEDARAAGALTVAPDLDPLASLVLAQRTGVALARGRGLDPDRPRNLTRSVVLHTEVPK